MAGTCASGAANAVRSSSSGSRPEPASDTTRRAARPASRLSRATRGPAAAAFAAALLGGALLPASPAAGSQGGVAVHRINCGGGDYVDMEGHLWSADYGFNTGKALGIMTDPTPELLADPRSGLFLTERYDRQQLPALTYTLALPAPGTYRVRLFFADTCHCTFTASPLYGTLSYRNFAIDVNGAEAIANFDIIRLVGWGKPVAQELLVTTSSASVEIGFRHGTVENPMVNAIEVVALDTASPVAAESVFVVTSAPTAHPTPPPTVPTPTAPPTALPTPEPTTTAPTSSAPTDPPPSTVSPTKPPTRTPTPAPTAPPTRAPTTQTPTTKAPTTKAPTVQVTTRPPTAVPTTQHPTTQAPTTTAPTSWAPTTEAPTTPSPTTPAPTTATPTTAAPSTPSPTTPPPTTAAPTTGQPTTATPTTATPTTAAPTTATPTSATPTTAQPTTASPTTAAPTTAQPTSEPTTLSVDTHDGSDADPDASQGGGDGDDSVIDHIVSLSHERTARLSALAAVLAVIFGVVLLVVVRRRRRRAHASAAANSHMDGPESLPRLEPEWDDHGVRSTNFATPRRSSSIKIGAGNGVGFGGGGGSGSMRWLASRQCGGAAGGGDADDHLLGEVSTDDATSANGSSGRTVDGPLGAVEPTEPTRQFVLLGHPHKSKPILPSAASAAMIEISCHDRYRITGDDASTPTCDYVESGGSTSPSSVSTRTFPLRAGSVGSEVA